MQHDVIDQLGPPDLKFAGFQVWVHSRELGETLDDKDDNWLRVTAHCGALGASVWVSGEIIEVTGFRDWAEELAQMNTVFAADE